MDVFNTTYRGKSIPIAAPSPLMAMTTRLKIEGDLAKYWDLIGASPEDKLPTGEKVRRFRVEGYLENAPPGTKAVYQSDQSPRGYSRIEDEVSISQRAIEANRERKRAIDNLPPERAAVLDAMAESLKPIFDKMPEKKAGYADPRREAGKFRYFLSQSNDVLDDLNRENDVKLNGLGIDIGKPTYRDQTVTDKPEQPKQEQPKSESPKRPPNIAQRKKIAENNPNQPNLLDLFG